MPNLLKVISIMDYIDKHLASGAVKMAYLPSIQVAMLIGKRLLHKYYDLMEYSEVYHITMGKLCFMYSLVSQLMSTQCFIQSANSVTSDQPDGKNDGLRCHMRSLGRSLIEGMQACSLRWRNQKRHQYVLYSTNYCTM